MERKEVLDWLIEHPQEVRDAPEEVLSRCEAAVHEHVTEEAWMRACAFARDRERYWLDDGGGCQASEAYVAREVCRAVADDLRRLEPVPEPGRLGAHVDAAALMPPGAAGRSLMLRYLLQVAHREEHRTWLEVMDFTRARGGVLASRNGFSSEHDHERTRLYAETAARVMHMLAEDLEQHAHPRAS